MEMQIEKKDTPAGHSRTDVICNLSAPEPGAEDRTVNPVPLNVLRLEASRFNSSSLQQRSWVLWVPFDGYA